MWMVCTYYLIARWKTSKNEYWHAHFKFHYWLKPREREWPTGIADEIRLRTLCEVLRGGVSERCCFHKRRQRWRARWQGCPIRQARGRARQVTRPFSLHSFSIDQWQEQKTTSIYNWSAFDEVIRFLRTCDHRLLNGHQHCSWLFFFSLARASFCSFSRLFCFQSDAREFFLWHTKEQ